MKDNIKTKRGTIVQTFQIAGITYSIVISDHAFKRMEQRKIDELQILSAITAMGGKRIMEYNNSNKDFAVIDKYHNLAIIATIENEQVIIITLLHTSDVWMRKGTEVISL